jgi:regulator of protease activity HflC (stomatin/prohibitin superfamily)
MAQSQTPGVSKRTAQRRAAAERKAQREAAANKDAEQAAAEATITKVFGTEDSK